MNRCRQTRGTGRDRLRCQGMHKISARQSCPPRGFSLVELMVALTIGLIILAAVAKIFATSRATYGYEEGMARVQENGRFAINFLQQDIRMAGYMGCNSLSANISNIASPATALTTYTAGGLQGFSGAGGTWSPPLPAGFFSSITPQPLPNTDVIIIQRASAINTHLASPTPPTNANIQIQQTTQLAQMTQAGPGGTPPPQLTAGAILMISDCKNADVFRATNFSNGSGIVTIAHSSTGNTTNFLAHSYYNDAQIMTLVSRAYYIAPGASGEPALWRIDLSTNGGSGVAQELVEGVESMKILYGEDTDGDGVANSYRAPGSVTNWQKVVTVRVGLVLRTPQNVDTNPDTRQYHLLGLSGASGALDAFGPPNDQRRRWVFTTTIRVRNHITS
jgi:type IV pilus assembly protein PilW